MQHRFISETLGLNASSKIPFLSDVALANRDASTMPGAGAVMGDELLAPVSLEAAAKEAQSRAKYLLVVFLSLDHESTAYFVESVLSDPSVVSLLQQSFLVYALPAPSDMPPYDCLRTSAQLQTFTLLQQEGLKMLSRANMPSDILLPHVTVLVKATRKVVGDISGGFDASTFVRFLGTQIEAVAGSIIQQEIVFAHDRQEREMMRALQDAELEEAKRQDRLKREEAQRLAREEEEARLEAQRREEEAARKEQERAEREAEEERRAAEKRAHVDSIMQRAQLVFERLCGTREPTPEDPKDAVCQLRLVDLKGNSHERLFFRSDTVAALYQFAQSLDPTYDGRSFRLVAGFPKRTPVPVHAVLATDSLDNHTVHDALLKELEGKLHDCGPDGIVLDDSWVTLGSCQPSLVPRAVVTLQEVIQ